MKSFKHSRKLNSKTIRGQGMSEYLIIVGLLAVAGIAVMGFMGGTIRNQVSGMAQELGGSTGVADQTAAAARATAATTAAQENTNLQNYTGNNTDLAAP